MKRKLINDLVKWKNSDARKPLLLLGARQVGKTWLMKDFGKRYYTNVAYVNCDAEISSHPDDHLKGLRISMKGYEDQGWMVNYPLYAISEIGKRNGGLTE